MKHPLYLLLFICLFSCQSRESDTPVETNPGAAADTTAALPAEPTAPDSAFLIVPGERVGQVELNMTSEELNRTLGEPDSGDAAMGKALMFWVSKSANGPRQYVAVYTVNNFDGSGSPPHVKQVQVTSPQFQTPNGTRTGQPLADIREDFEDVQPLAYYTNAQQQRVYIYDDTSQGIAFEVTVPDSVCTAITVHAPGEAVTGTYLPVHPDLTRLK